jgi:hypothetical protein
MKESKAQFLHHRKHNSSPLEIGPFDVVRRGILVDRPNYTGHIDTLCGGNRKRPNVTAYGTFG